MQIQAATFSNSKLLITTIMTLISEQNIEEFQFNAI